MSFNDSAMILWECSTNERALVLSTHLVKTRLGVIYWHLTIVRKPRLWQMKDINPTFLSSSPLETFWKHNLDAVQIQEP